MADGPSLPVHGTIRRTPDEPERVNFASVGPAPMLVGVGGEVRVWRDRARVRVETLDGQPVFVTDGETAWKFDEPGQPPLRSTSDRVRYLGTGSDLLVNRPATDWLGDDYTRPAGPVEDVTFLGRECWAVDLAPPPRKSGALRLTVDRESGAVLEERNDTAGFDVGYVELAVGPAIDPALFTWSGPARDLDEEGRARSEQRSAEQARQQEWFRANVADSLPVLRIPMPLTLERILHLDEDTGAFEAAVGTGAAHLVVARRPRSGKPWNLHWHGTVHRWSTDGYDWCVSLPAGELDAESLGALQAALGPGQRTSS